MNVRKGATRTVILFRSFAIKFPTFLSFKLFLNGLLANLQERELSGVHPDLAPVSFSLPFGLLVVMKRAEEIQIDNIDWEELRDLLQAKYSTDSMREFMLSDLKPSNWGFIDNRLVKIDYGS